MDCTIIKADSVECAVLLSLIMSVQHRQLQALFLKLPLPQAQVPVDVRADFTHCVVQETGTGAKIVVVFR